MTLTIDIEDAHSTTLARVVKESGKTPEELAAGAFRAFLVQQAQRQEEIVRLAEVYRTVLIER